MKFYKISSVIVETDPEISYAAKKVVDERKMMRDVIGLYGWEYNQGKIDELADAVLDLRKERSLPVEKILEAFDEASLQFNPFSIKSLAKKINVNIDDVVWVVRRHRPERKIKLTPNEISQIIALKEGGVSGEEIAKKLHIGTKSITDTIRKYKRELLVVYRDSEFWDKICAQYDALVANGETHNEAMKKIMEKDKTINESTFLKKLHAHGVYQNSYHSITEDDKIKIMEMAYNGLSGVQIAKTIGCSNVTVLDIIKKTDPKFYMEKITQTREKDVSAKIKSFISDLFYNNHSINNIRFQVKEKFNLDIGSHLVRTITKNVIRKNKSEDDFPIEEINPTEVSQKTTHNRDPEYAFEEPLEEQFGQFSFMGKRSTPLTYEEIRKRKEQGRYLTPEEIEEIKKKTVSPVLPVASVSNWYKFAQGVAYAGWILPNGEIRTLDKESRTVSVHYLYVRDNPEEFGLTQEEVRGKAENCYQNAFRKGAVRFFVNSISTNIEGNLMDIRRNVEKIHEIAKKFNSVHIFISEPNGYFKRTSILGLYRL